MAPPEAIDSAFPCVHGSKLNSRGTTPVTITGFYSRDVRFPVSFKQSRQARLATRHPLTLRPDVA